MKVIKIIQEYASLAITCIIMIIGGMAMCVSLKGVDNWKDPMLWIEMGFNTVLQVVMIVIWLPEGKKRGATNDVYKTNSQNANQQMQEAGAAQNFKYLTEFCKIATEKNRFAWIANRARKYAVNYDQWNDEEYRAQFSLKVQEKIAKFERLALKRVKEIKATETITNSEIYLVYDTKDHTDHSATIKVAIKMALSLTMCAIGAFIAIDRVQFALEALYKFLYWLLVACLSIFFSIRTGYKLITEDRNDYYKRIIVFLSHFDEWKTTQNKTCTTTEEAPK